MTEFLSLIKMTGQPAASPRLAGAALRGVGLVGASAPCAGASAVLVALPVRELDERATKAPAAAQECVSASVASGAGLRKSAYRYDGWSIDRFGTTGTITNETTQHHLTMRAFRGLEPWRDPS